MHHGEEGGPKFAHEDGIPIGNDLVREAMVSVDMSVKQLGNLGSIGVFGCGGDADELTKAVNDHE